jgi:hypothetical protein
MPLQYDQVYLLTNVGGNFLEAPMIAMGVRERHGHSEKGGWRQMYQFLVNNDVHGGHQIFGDVVLDEDGVVELKDIEKVGDDGKEVVWRFEPLTLELWRTLGAQGHILGYEEIDSIPSDAELHEFYKDRFLHTDTWPEHDR